MHHSGHKEAQSCGSNMCIVENREAESLAQTDGSVIAEHVWETCRPVGNLATKTPTVSARRVQLMRVHLQSQKECEGSTEEATPQMSCTSKQQFQNGGTCPCSRAQSQVFSKGKPSMAEMGMECSEEEEGMEKREYEDEEEGDTEGADEEECNSKYNF